ncbi:DsbA family oxidoreductase [Tenacibaculum jejuense]|uniref:DSBA oxidoreductase n=1 Tax=Tenacibaculum jejuense TaxID=584609 RepID=A0A238UC36_9FLAO|nr:DsbA family oxidoreductase [Tenacibaculum jejuense]SNR16777.1 DSBA oxidoreductase [Tenacibaculum jejuense]
MKNTLKIDIVSDVVCPWCTVGYKHLKKAIDELDIADQIEIEWQPFELNPNMPKEGQDLTEHITQKYGSTKEQHEASRSRLVEAGANVDFKFDFYENMKIVNTFDAHVLLEYAKQFGKQTELKMRLTTAYFSERKDVSKQEVLKQALLDVGLNAEEALAKLNDDDARFEVQRNKQHWQNLGVRSVPTIVFDRKEAVTGAQPIGVFKSVLREFIKPKAI